jgi:hypothetical protein
MTKSYFNLSCHLKFSFSNLKHLLKYTLWTFVILIMGVFCWSYFAVKYYINSGFTAIFIGMIIGIFTALNYNRRNALFYWMSAGISSLFAYYLGKYIIFEFYSGQINIHADTSIAKSVWSILLKTNATTIAEFAKYHIINFDVFDFLWPTTSFILALYHARKVVTHKQYLNKFKKKLKR